MTDRVSLTTNAAHSPALPAASRWRWVARGAVAIYCLLAFLLILQNPGLQYDEALLVLGAVQMRHSPQELPLPHDPNTWFCARDRCLPLMTVRYVGALKEYLCLPLFALFGPSAAAVRFVSTLLGMLGIWGIGRLLREQVSEAAGALTALALALHPAYVDLTVFDNGTVSVWTGSFGVLCWALSRYLGRGTARSAFWLGAAAGLGVWARANFSWLLLALCAAALLVWHRRMLRSAAHWAVMVAGAAFGAAPFLIYQILSGGGTWQAIGMFSTHDSLAKQLSDRWIMFSETLLSDREHRAIWGGAAMPDWQRWLFPAILVVACAICLRTENLWARGITLTMLLLGALLFASPLPVAEHHLIVLVPLAAAACVLAACAARARYPRAWIPLTALAVIYAGCAITWQIAAIQGLHQTGGVGQWSNAVFSLARVLRERYPAREIIILDWGLQNSLYIIDDGQPRTREVLDNNLDAARLRTFWKEQIPQGGVYLLNGPENRYFPASAEAFVDAVRELGVAFRRRTFRQRDGAVFAQIVEIQPNAPRADQAASTISAGDSSQSHRLEGFHAIEPGGWRWTRRRFAITLDWPAESDARLELELYIPETSIRKLGPITLSARAGGHALAVDTYSREGAHTFARQIDAQWLRPGPNRFEFALDKWLPPERDARELGVIVKSASLEMEE